MVSSPLRTGVSLGFKYEVQRDFMLKQDSSFFFIYKRNHLALEKMRATAQEQTQLHSFGLGFLNRNSEGSKVQTGVGCYSLKHGPDSDAWRHILYLIAQCAESQERREQANL